MERLAAARPPRDLHGKVALVTGAATGIGAAAAITLASAGAALVCVDIEERVADVVGEIRRNEGSATACVADVTDRDAMLAAVDLALREYERLDTLVANAGAHLECPATDVTTADWHRMLDVNLTGVWYAIQAALPPMIAERSGSIIAVSSIGGVLGVNRVSAYAAAKGGVIALCRQLAIEYGPAGIRVNTVCPATIAGTPMVDQAFRRRAGGDVEQAERAIANAAAQYPLGRLGETGDVAELVVFLASDASSWMTGGTHIVDGGISVAMRPPEHPPRPATH
jgi:NAD(P)-dependent dehydrogenase (short-subunit alcohol dehydrogenase family)